MTPDPALEKLAQLIDLASRTQRNIAELLTDQGCAPDVIAREADRASRLALIWGADHTCTHSQAADATRSQRAHHRTRQAPPPPNRQPPNGSLMPRKPPARPCKGTNRQGNPCGAAPQTNSDYCRAHDPLLPAETRFGSPAQARQAAAQTDRRPYPKLRETVERRIEARADEVVGAGLEALKATSMIVDKDGREHIHEDGRTRLHAANVLMERGLGKPASDVHVSADVRAAVLAIPVMNAEARATIADLLRTRPAVRELDETR